jgi:ABC-2 type transport system ATP-binding protein
MSDALLVKDLSRSFARPGIRFRKDTRGLASVSFSVPQGACFGFVGPNGAGKTTLIKTVLGLIRKDKGEISVFGKPHEDPAWRVRVGYLPEQPYFYDHLNASEYLDLSGRLFGLPSGIIRERSKALLERLGLAASARIAMRKFSKGMLQRLGVAQAMINDPDLLILDEPMSGLDPLGRRDLRQLFLDLRDKGKTLFFSSHILSDVETLCDSVAVLREGRLVATGRLSEVLKVDTDHVEVTVSLPEASAAGFAPSIPRVFLGDERHRLDVPAARLFEVIEETRKAAGQVLSVHPVRKTLEEFFVQGVNRAQ